MVETEECDKSVILKEDTYQSELQVLYYSHKTRSELFLLRIKIINKMSVIEMRLLKIDV